MGGAVFNDTRYVITIYNLGFTPVLFQVCDSLQDCEDGQDEAECGALPACEEDEFACPKGRCIPASWKCDGTPDCRGGEDEVACSNFCSQEEFLCGEGRCLPKVRTCDGTPDCAGGEDEERCSCGATGFQCRFGGGCVDQSVRCDDIADCADRSDELGCLGPRVEPTCGRWQLSSELTSQLAGGVAEEGQPLDNSLKFVN